MQAAMRRLQTDHLPRRHPKPSQSAHIAQQVGRKVEVVPIEAVVRGYLTGVTDTAIWTHYGKGQRDFGGLKLPDAMRKNVDTLHDTNSFEIVRIEPKRGDDGTVAYYDVSIKP